MATVEVSAKTLDEAKAAAAQKLGVSVDQINVVSVEEQKGLFGKGSVKLRAEAAAAPATAPEAAEEPKAEKPARAARAAKAPAKEKPARATKATKAKAATETEEAPAEAPEAEAPGEEPKAEVIASAADEKKIVEIVEALLKSGSLDAHVSKTSRSGKYVNIALDGRDVAHLVGKHGEVLNALQYLVNVTVTQQLQNGVRATIDGNDYRAKREDALTKLATNIGSEVKKRGEEAVLDALPAFERRIVHKALASMEGVTTYSEGEEPNRRVVIAPAE